VQGWRLVLLLNVPLREVEMVSSRRIEDTYFALYNVKVFVVSIPIKSITPIELRTEFLLLLKGIGNHLRVVRLLENLYGPRTQLSVGTGQDFTQKVEALPTGTAPSTRPKRLEEDRHIKEDAR
jgi:hypothetical protein